MRTIVALLLLLLASVLPAEESRPDPILIEDRIFENLSGEALRLENREDVVVRGFRCRSVGVAIRLVNCRRITIQSCAIGDLGILGFDTRGGRSDIRILDNVITGFRDDVQGGHLIPTD